ncbi:MAG: hypothetical protein R3C56_10690 [Pirellulaceae bacterium]
MPTASSVACWALVITQQSLTVASLKLALSRSAASQFETVRSLVTHYFHLMEQEGEDFTQAA